MNYERKHRLIAFATNVRADIDQGLNEQESLDRSAFKYDVIGGHVAVYRRFTEGCILKAVQDHNMNRFHELNQGFSKHLVPSLNDKKFIYREPHDLLNDILALDDSVPCSAIKHMIIDNDNRRAELCAIKTIAENNDSVIAAIQTGRIVIDANNMYQTKESIIEDLACNKLRPFR